MNVNCYKVLAIPGGNTTPGVQAIQWNRADDPDQQSWLF
ncbi:hypothetical protein [Kribbella sp. VKM Ac-2571]